MNILLVEPNFPIPSKSKNHSSFLPIGLLKIGSYHKSQGDNVQLVRGNVEKSEISFKPNEIKITSLFTYWSEFVAKSAKYYRMLFPKAKIEVGGIFASLMPDKCREITNCDEVKVGQYRNGIAENIAIDYSILKTDLDYQIVHASRGCFRKCSFCGTWKIEPKIYYRNTITDSIHKNRLIFYDNNLLANPNIENIFDELANHKLNNRVVHSECQSGIDGRILIKNPLLAKKMKLARFQNPRIAWDGSVSNHKKIKKQIKILKEAGYKAGCDHANIYVFMLFNHNQPYIELSQKLEFCRRWGVLVIDCRFRPLNLLSDGYNPRLKKQKDNEYYIHKGWSDWKVRRFRRKVRRQNIAIRLGLPNNKYIEGVEKGYVPTKFS